MCRRSSSRSLRVLGGILDDVEVDMIAQVFRASLRHVRESNELSDQPAEKSSAHYLERIRRSLRFYP